MNSYWLLLILVPLAIWFEWRFGLRGAVYVIRRWRDTSRKNGSLACL